MPAQSPTLSPTLSAMVAGLRGSSSGMPASTFPTRSPPTSAPLVKMPPPRRAKIEISEAPKPSATSESMTSRLEDAKPGDAGEIAEIERDAEEREAGDEHARHRTRLEGDVEPLPERMGRRLGGADVGANRHVHADEARPRADRMAPIGEADRDANAEEIGDHDEEHDADDGDGGVLAAQIGLRTLGDRAGDLLHALGAGIPLHHVVDGPQAIGDRQEAAQNDQE